ncbi:uncharacterized protein CDV56_106408 [Aspergillus thermomutatus]|uniref:Uncharacterized protein n=1 Tax=Aspergillus thermomutatus TaxID=41047 RepID=A0A397H580_ASPTH|nr:uncharacterized protein CDV56_106408 [Aspergillus thermomutatus]RHZ58241.1 hypothetical protein CDV56_106408 [Aspergillus thermomutatus]
MKGRIPKLNPLDDADDSITRRVDRICTFVTPAEQSRAGYFALFQALYHEIRVETLLGLALFRLPAARGICREPKSSYAIYTMSEVDKRLQVSLHTPSGSFSEAVAVSQGAINKNLDNLLKLYPDFATINISAHDGTMDAKLDSGRVALHILDNNRGMVDYFCTFKSGTVSVWDDELDNFTDPIDMTGWVFAFAVNMGSADVDESTDEYQDIASAFAQPGDYSIWRLYNSNQIASFK